MIQEELATFVQLLRAIYAPQNVYCVHVDEKAPKKFKTAVHTLVNCFENVFISSENEKAASAGFPRLQAEINCMKDLVHAKLQWSYVINLRGQDFPIKTNKEIIRHIRSKWTDKNIAPGVIQTPNAKAQTSQSHPELSPEGHIRVSPHRRFKDEPLHNVTIYSGSAHYILTRKFVEFLLTDVRAKAMLQWAKGMRSPEQHYWVTLSRLRGHYVQDACVFGPGDLPWIIQSPSLFASKFEPSAEPLVVLCLERWHRLRVLGQAEVPTEPHWHFRQQSHFNMS
ncbi:Beta-1,3-galactosyl-O-glycosyl-glycoprotein beta-1,6-N-acetylglucosaminyltransferase 7 [Tupaia chinensis]|uniref:Beta-1,3-galactosyl-O-glycosyl-glycoprotein beta-1,6-N-acetylglucosaminyltransferase 7 n=1 Tax=Tupaia chinensis TaxID=246437 RepID=L9L8H2_TUPCH|nr:Beta-1,3-galactosyl-O-glycosyl-glycoprotein beta-1,6-N-acetylglucosaminyltransferase 7 [Tupaia chinensis]